MNLNEYFESRRGTGVLATSDNEGRVNAAIYARPHVVDDQTLAFIMDDRQSYHNVTQNPHAAFLFREASDGYQGKRLHLTRTREENDPQKILHLRRRTTPDECQQLDGKRLVFFHVDQVRPLVGD